MVRRANAGKRKQSARLFESINPSAEGVELPPESNNPPLEIAVLEPSNRNQSLVKVEPQPKTQANSHYVSSSKKGKQTVSLAFRRSVRLQGTVMPACNQDIERVLDEIVVSESEKEEDEPPAYEETKQPDPTTGNKSLGDKIDYILQLLEEQQESRSGNSCLSDARYKSLYIDSQKKIEALTDENRQLAMKLENALGKLEAYENGNRGYTEMMEKLKDVILISSLTRATEAAANASAQAINEAYNSQDIRESAKRRKKN